MCDCGTDLLCARQSNGRPTQTSYENNFMMIRFQKNGDSRK
jgi:hypothetical protein